jgi:hypothetical protein
MDVLQCPECPLRFRNESELKQHIALDQPDFDARAKTTEDSRRRNRAPTYRRDDR